MNAILMGGSRPAPAKPRLSKFQSRMDQLEWLGPCGIVHRQGRKPFSQLKIAKNDFLGRCDWLESGVPKACFRGFQILTRCGGMRLPMGAAAWTCWARN
jgi:hypothetical protein